MNDNGTMAASTAPRGGLDLLSGGLTRVFLRQVMQEQRMTTQDLAEWIGCSESEIWNLMSRTDGRA
ncbi:hypothetical protein [Breoghania sp. JC706]|uniref:hypothetical protein n=1 Tax=Breoghania sp. JC706 TaxID=3117732 RepID=UPI0030099C8D